jgi:DNA-binding phage protein
MGKTKTSKKRRGSSMHTQKKEKTYRIKKGASVRESDPTHELLEDDFISRALWECLKAGDHEGYAEVLYIYLEAHQRFENRKSLAKEAEIGRSTLYQIKHGNPTVKTLAKLVHATV